MTSRESGYMRWSAISLVVIAAFAACSSAQWVPDDAMRLMAEAPCDQPARLLVVSNRVVTASVAISRSSLPPAVRTTIDAVAPLGKTLFRGREWSDRGDGYRIEKEYLIDGSRHVRTALIDADGHVLERAHSVPIGEVPQAILGAALEIGPEIREMTIVSGPEREEFWRATVGTRIGRTYVVRIGLGGQLLHVRRRVIATIDV